MPWQVILVKSMLLIAKIDTDWVSETIPLHKIDRVPAIVCHGLPQRARLRFKSSMAWTSQQQ
jgi:hypothetical protein